MKWLLLIAIIAVLAVGGCNRLTTTTTTTITVPGTTTTTTTTVPETTTVSDEFRLGQKVDIVNALSGNMKIMNTGDYDINITDLSIYIDNVSKVCSWNADSVEPGGIVIANCSCTTGQKVKIIAPGNIAMGSCEISENMTCIAADMTIENVYIDLSTNTSRVIVRNSGSANNQIISAQLLNDTGVSCPVITALPISFPIGSLKSIEFNITGKISSCPNFKEVKVTTDCATKLFTKDPICL
jgi:hypothetical protein